MDADWHDYRRRLDRSWLALILVLAAFVLAGIVLILGGDWFFKFIGMPLYAAGWGWYMRCYWKLAEFRCPQCGKRFAIDFSKIAGGGFDYQHCKHCGCAAGTDPGSSD